MANLKERALTPLAKEMGNAGYCNYAACDEFLTKAWNAAVQAAAEIARRCECTRSGCSCADHATEIEKLAE